MRLLGMLHDVICVTLVVPVAFLVRTGELPELTASVLVFQGSLILAGTISFYVFGLNQGSWRYASIEDLLGIIQAAALAMLLAVIATFLVSRLDTIPRMVPPIGVVALVILMSAPRLIYRLIKDRHIQRIFASSARGEPVLVVGYSDEASIFLRSLARQRDPVYQVVGIIDHNNRHVGRRLHATRVIGTLGDIGDILKNVRASGGKVAKIVLSPSKLDAETTASLVDIGAEHGVPVFSLPDAAELTSAQEDSEVRPVPIRIEDLLGRPVADIDLAPVASMLRGKDILVTGGGGSIGSELVDQIMAYRPKHLVILENGEHNLYSVDQRIRERYPDASIDCVLCDVRDRAAVRGIMLKASPDIVFHAAALKHVPLVEHNPVEGARTNVFGTINVADAAVEAGASAFVMISTDKAVNPTNVMGATKRFAEAYCQMLDLQPDCRTRFMTVRFGNVLGSAGSVVPQFTRQIAEGGPVTVTHPDVRRYFMSMKEAVRLVLAASAKGLEQAQDRGRIMVLNMGTQIRIVDLATRMIQLAGLRPGLDIPIIYTGLRPGEKLYEERLAASERVEPTDHAWLEIALPREIDGPPLSVAIARLEDAVERRDEARLIAAIQSVVPELISSHRALDGGSLHGQPAGNTIVLADKRGQFRK